MVSISFKICSDGAGKTVKICIKMGKARVFITQTLPIKDSDLKDQSFKRFLTDLTLFL